MALKVKKYLGQHFLKNRSIARKIVEAANIEKTDTILEVGPGRGALTELLLQKAVPAGSRASQIIAIEKDKELVQYLKDKFVHYENLSVIHGDILKIENLKLIENWKLKIENYKIVANIPYYITSRFLRKFLETDCQPSLMVLMVQKEVAERIIAKDGKESLLSISVKVYGQPKIIAKVSAENFSPKPKVDSAIIAIENISKSFFKDNRIDEKRFFQMLKLGFSHKRKLLKNNLKIGAETLQKCKIPPLSRAEDLSLENWKCLYKIT